MATPTPRHSNRPSPDGGFRPFAGMARRSKPAVTHAFNLFALLCRPFLLGVPLENDQRVLISTLNLDSPLAMLLRIQGDR